MPLWISIFLGVFFARLLSDTLKIYLALKFQERQAEKIKKQLSEMVAGYAPPSDPGSDLASRIEALKAAKEVSKNA